MKRRTFIAGTAATAGLSLTLSKPLMAMRNKAEKSKYLDTIGLQLWTVRNQMEEDQSATLKAVKEAGYKQVELMRVTGSKDIVDEAKKLDLNVTSAFVEWNSVLGLEGEHPSLKSIIADAKKFGLQHLVFGCVAKGHRETVDLVKTIAAKANGFGQMCNDAGIKLCYHNHSFEFEAIDGETTGFDVLMDELDNEKCKFELDVFWAKIGGWDPFETMEKLKGRMSQIHLKDLKADTPVNYDEGAVPHEAFEELGDGSIDMAKVLQLAEKLGVEQCHVEQDQSPGPIASIGQSMKHLQGLTS